MFSNIIVGVNGRDGGHDAAALASALADPGTRLTFGRVRISDIAPGQDPASDDAERRLAPERIEAERRIWTGPAQARSIFAPSVGEGLEQLAAHRQADLIVIGACERAAMGRVIVGDDAASVIRQAQRAVAVAPRGYSSAAHRIHRIGVAYDGSTQSQVAYRLAQELAQGLDASLVARCVVTPHVFATGVGSGAAYMEDPEDLVRRTRASLGDTGERVDIVVGPIGQALVEFSQTVDLLVSGSRHNNLLRRVMLGSTSGYLAHHSGCPLLIAGPAVPVPGPAVEQPAAPAVA